MAAQVAGRRRHLLAGCCERGTSAPLRPRACKIAVILTCGLQTDLMTIQACCCLLVARCFCNAFLLPCKAFVSGTAAKLR